LADFVANNLFVLLAGLLVFTMTPSVGLLELGELGEDFEEASLLKVMLIAGIGLLVMAIVGFNTAFAPTVANGLIGNPLYGAGLFLGASSANAAGLISGVFWSMTPEYFGAGLTTGTYFLFETAFAIVTLALVGVVVLKKVKLQAFALFSVPYLVVIWNLPAAWIWNPTGWLYTMGVRDFAGGVGGSRGGRCRGVGNTGRGVARGKEVWPEGEPSSPDQCRPDAVDALYAAPLGGLVRLQLWERPGVRLVGHSGRHHYIPGGGVGLHFFDPRRILGAEA